MIKRLLISFTIVLLAIAAHAAPDKPGTTSKSTKSGGLRFEISFSKEMSPTPIDGHVLLLISDNDEKEPRFQISYNVPESQQVFGADVDGLAAQALEVLRDPPAYRCLGRAAARHISERYNIDHWLPRFAAFLEGVRERGTSRR